MEKNMQNKKWKLGLYGVNGNSNVGTKFFGL